MRQGGEKMDQEKPFKTIEVVDSKTNQICKVACMSCIRGHRTTSCGIPVCRTKIFWTVKRPGRPSNSCTCRYGATGGCKCVVARSACPHKSKKGEKRSGECRCDEQGRYCCLLEPDHWTALFALQKPTVDFYSSREVLEVKQTATMPMQHFSPAPNYAMTSPSREASVPSTPGIDLHTHASQGIPATYASFSRQSSLTPRFNLMGIAAPQGPHHGTPLDPLVWDNDVPIPPRNFPPPYTDSISARGAHPSTSMPPIQHGVPQNSIIEHSFAHHEPMRDLSLPRPYNATGEVDERHNTIVPSALSPPQTSSYDFERLQADYYHYQFPSAICQNCGLSGCTCKNCPPPFQNPGTGGWTQCCGRKHGRDPAPAPVPHKVRRSSGYDGIQGIHQHAQFQQPAGGSHGPPAPQKTDGSEHTPFYVDQTYINGFTNITPTDFDAFNPEHDFVMPDGSAPLDIADYLNIDLGTVPGEDVPRGDVVRGDVPRGDLLRGAVPRREVPTEDIPTEGRNGCCCKGS